MDQNKRIAFVLNKATREIPIVERISREIKKQSPTTDILIVPSAHDSEFIPKLIGYNPDVVVTYPFTGRLLSRPFYLVKRFTGCTLICYRTEGLINVDGGAVVHAGQDSYCKSLVDYEVFWGSAVRNAISEVLLGQDKLSSADRAIVLGYPRYEFFRELNEQQSRIGKKSQPTINNRQLKNCIHNFSRNDRLLFLSGFHFADYTDDDLILAGDLSLDDLEDWKLLRNALRQFRKEWISNLCNLAKCNPKNLFILKKHPMEVIAETKKQRSVYTTLTEFPNVCIIDDEDSTMELLGLSGVLFHYGSTVALESFICGVPSVILKSNRLFRQVQYAYRAVSLPAHATFEIEDMEQAVQLWNDGGLEYSHLPEMDQLLYDIFDIQDIREYRPAERIGKFLLQDHTPQRIHFWNSFFRKAAVTAGRKCLKSLVLNKLGIRSLDRRAA